MVEVTHLGERRTSPISEVWKQGQTEIIALCQTFKVNGWYMSYKFLCFLNVYCIFETLYINMHIIVCYKLYFMLNDISWWFLNFKRRELNFNIIPLCICVFEYVLEP